MKAISESNLQSSLDSGSTKRLSDYKKRLASDSTQRIYDDQALEVLLKYAWNPARIQEELKYLENLTNDEGALFCRSMGKYADMQKQFSGFAAPEKASFRWNRHFRRAVARVGARYADAQLKMRKYTCDEDIYNSVTDWSTATGWEYIVSGRRKKVDVLSDVFNAQIERETKAKEEGTFGVPVICGTRTQGSGAYDENGARTNTWKSKKRAVFMVDVYTVIAESRFGAEINEWLKTYPYSAIGKDDMWITRWVSYERNQGKGFLSLDYSKYDSTIPSWLIRSAFDVIRGMFTEYDAELLKVIEEDFINKNIITADGVLHVGHGNPSGSRLTAIINGICNEIITETWLDAFGYEGQYNIMGDDNLIYLSTQLDDASKSLIGQYIVHNFGIVVNTDKSNFGTSKDDPEYLSRYWSHSGPWRHMGEVVSLIAYPERFRPYHRKDISLTPEMIIFSYVLAYRRTMSEMIDVNRFMRDANLHFYSIKWSKEQREAIPYNLRLFVELNNYYSRPTMGEILEGQVTR